MRIHKRAVTPRGGEKEIVPPGLPGRKVSQVINDIGSTGDRRIEIQREIEYLLSAKKGKYAPPKPEDIALTVMNLVVTCSVGTKVNLDELTMRWHEKGAQYNPKRFSAIILRLRSPKTALLIFGSGKIVCTGATSKVKATTALRLVEKWMIEAGSKAAKLKEPKIENMVAKADVGFRVDLSELSQRHGQYTTLSPLFPGAILRHPENKRVTVLIFNSGCLVITGAKSSEEIRESFMKVYPLIRQCILTPDKVDLERLAPSWAPEKNNFSFNNMILKTKKY